MSVLFLLFFGSLTEYKNLKSDVRCYMSQDGYLCVQSDTPMTHIEYSNIGGVDPNNIGLECHWYAEYMSDNFRNYCRRIDTNKKKFKVYVWFFNEITRVRSAMTFEVRTPFISRYRFEKRQIEIQREEDGTH